MSSENVNNKAALWEKLQEIHRKETEELEAEKKRLKHEKETMAGVTADDSDIIEINAGGQAIIQCHRRTLCLATDSMFSHMFSGRWDQSCAKDSQGRFFLDHDPELILLIVNHLRAKRIEDPGNPVPPPAAPYGKHAAWVALLNYFGLTDYFNAGGGRFPQLSADVSCHEWKIIVESLPHKDCWLFLGLIGTLELNLLSHTHETSFGWASNSEVYHRGSMHLSQQGWSDFVEGEVLYFQLKEVTFSMFSVQKDTLFTLEGITGDMYLHFHSQRGGTVVKISSLNADEQLTFQQKLVSASS